MRYIGYKELNTGDFPSLKESLEENPYPNKEKILVFLQNGIIDLTRMSRAKDVFDGEVIPFEIHVMHRGKFSWSNQIAWYVEKYNLRLPNDFESYIIEDGS